MTSEMFSDEFVRSSELAVPEELRLANEHMAMAIGHLHHARVHALALEACGRWGRSRCDVSVCSDAIASVVKSTYDFAISDVRHVSTSVANDEYLAEES